MSWNKRTELLLGAKRMVQLKKSHVLIVGIGGVGASAAEQLVRGGVGYLTIVDPDIIEDTNINRQLPALHSTLGMRKVDVMEKRLLDINPKLKLTILNEYLRDERMIKVLETNFNYIVDAIDTLAPKVYLIYHSIRLNIPIISSMGSGGKINPCLIQITDISKTHHCQLARMVRKRLHKLGVKKGVRTVFSPEIVKKEAILLEKNINKASNVGTISYMPNIFGCLCASEVLRNL